MAHDYFFYIRFALAWSCWLVFADKDRWREILPVCVFASFLGLISDQIVTFHITYWQYYDSGPRIIRELLDDFGLYIVVTYLFIQWLPTKRPLVVMVLYWFAWTAFAIIVKFIHVKTGHMQHFNGWNYWYSYLADWLLYTIFYAYYKLFKLERLSR